MALNDFYSTHKCLVCGSNVEETRLCDTWGDHVLSKYKCTNKECDVSANDWDENIDDLIKTTLHYHERDNT